MLTSLASDDLDRLVTRALHDLAAPELDGIVLTPSAQKTLVASADGDARKLLNNL